MIEIRDGRIYFYNANKPQVQARDFQCISAYVCPHCKNVLVAYFVGHMTPEILPDFAENDSMRYAYEIGGCDGGKWIVLQEYPHKSACRWQYSTARGLGNGVDFYLKYHKSTMEKPALIDAIEKGMEGFVIVPDEIGADAPLLMYNENEIVDAKEEGLTFDEKWKRIEKMGEYLESKLQVSFS